MGLKINIWLSLSVKKQFVQNNLKFLRTNILNCLLTLILVKSKEYYWVITLCQKTELPLVFEKFLDFFQNL